MNTLNAKKTSISSSPLGKTAARALLPVALALAATLLAACSSPISPTSPTPAAQETVSTPEISPAAGTYDSAQTLTIVCDTSGARIRYTTDGSVPSNGNGNPYTAPLTVSTNQTIKAVAFKTGWTNSQTATTAYTINLPHGVTYDANGGGGPDAAPPTDAGAYQQGATVTVLGNTGSLVKTDYAFAGWTTSTTGPGSSYAAGATFAMASADVTLYAVWIPTTMTFESSGSSITVTGPTDTFSGALTIPDGVTGIADHALSNWDNNTSLTSVSIPASVISLSSGAFSICLNLSAISVDASNPAYESLDGVLFDKAGATLIRYPCDRAATGYAIPASVTSISDYAFYGSSRLTSVNLPSSLATLGQCAFQNCTGLTGVTIPSGLSTIGDMAFASCSGMASLTIESGVSVIGNNAFNSCAKLTTVTIGSGVSKIDVCAFVYCSSLTSVTIPATVNQIGEYAFSSCTKLASVTVLAVTPPVLATNAYVFGDCASGLVIHVPTGTVASYQGAVGWSSYTIQSP
jgi:hypothetical protein